MLVKYGELALWLVSQIPAALGEFMPLCIGGAALFLASRMIRRVLRRGF